MSAEDFSKLPESLAERRMRESDDCTKWTPRDVLLHFLRDIDNGSLVPDGLIVLYLKHVEGNTLTGMRRSRVAVLEAVGMCESAKHDLLDYSAGKG